MGHQGREKEEKETRTEREREREKRGGGNEAAAAVVVVANAVEKKTSHCNSQRLFSRAPPSLSLSLRVSSLYSIARPASTYQHAAPPLGLPQLQASVLPRRGERAPIGRRRSGDDGRGAPVDEAGAVEGDHAIAAAASRMMVLMMLMLGSSRRRRMSRWGSSGSG